MTESPEQALRHDGWIDQHDLRRGMPNLDDAEFANLMLNMEEDGFAEFKLVNGTRWMRVTYRGLAAAGRWHNALAKAH